MKKTKLIRLTFYVVLFAVVFYVIRCAPLLTDDYIFLSSNAHSIKQAFNEALHYGNGRLLGNFLSAYMVQHKTVMDVERSLITTLLIILLPKILPNRDEEKKFLYTVVSAVLVLGMCPRIFSEVFSWASGFHNYVPPVLISLICFLLVNLNEKNIWQKSGACVLIFIFGIASQLFLELSTLVSICFSAFLVIFFFINKRDKLSKSIVWFISTVVGGAIMFILPRCFEKSGLVSGEGYRNIHLNGIFDIISSASGNAYEAFYNLSRCEIVFIFLAILTLLMLKKQKEKWQNKKIYSICCVSVCATMFFFLINCIIGKYTVFTKFEIPNGLISAMAIAVFVVSFIITVTHLPKGSEKNMIIISSVLSVFSVCPMLIVDPFSSRCMFMSYIFIAIDAILMFDIMIKEKSAEEIKKATGVSVLAWLALACCLIVTFTDIHWLDTQQIKYIEAKMKEKPSQVEIFNYESSYVYTGRTWGFAYCYYNNKQFDVEFKDFPFAEWYAHRQAEGWFK